MISHDFIKNNVAQIKIGSATYEAIPEPIANQWLKCGYVDIKGELTPKDQTIPTISGVPQGGPISPTISNVVINGIEKAVDEAVRRVPNFSSEQTMSPRTKITWYKEGLPIVSTFGCSSLKEIYSILSPLGFFTEKAFQPRYLLTKNKQKEYGYKYDIIFEENLSEVSRSEINESWNKTFRFADDCAIFVNSERAVDAAIKGIKAFLEPRGLQLNEEKTLIKNLHKGDRFRFVGFEFALERRHGKHTLYDFPPADKIQNVKETIEEVFRVNKRNPYKAFREINPVIKGWLNFYACGNSKTIFQGLSNWLWHKTYRYFWNFHKNNKQFKRTSQTIFKRKLSLYIWNRYPNPAHNNKKWWAIPFLNTPQAKKLTSLYGNRNPYFLYWPAYHKVATPGIILGLSAFFPDERLKLEEKERSVSLTDASLVLISKEKS